MFDLREFFGSLNLDEQTSYKGLTVFPLRGEPADPPYDTLDEAIRSGLVEVTEVSDGGSVPELRLVNRSDRPVLLLDGEELLGAKQNRIVNLTILVPAGKTLHIPVSCVEAHRWNYQNRDFVPSAQAQFRKGRARKAASVSSALELGLGERPDQAMIWNDIGDKLACMGASSPTQAMKDLFDQRRGDLDGYLARFTPIDGQLGAVFALGPTLAGLELFDSPTTLRGLFPKIISSYAIDALELSGNPGACSHADAAGFMDRVGRAKLEPYPAVGMGSTLRISAPGISGGGLLVDDRLVHLAAFAQNDDPR